MTPTITHYDGTNEYPVLIAFLFGEDLGGWPNDDRGAFMEALHWKILETIGYDDDFDCIEIERAAPPR